MNLEKICLKNKLILLISIILLTLILVTIIIFNNKDNSNNIISNIKKEEPIINSNMITMMYETDAGSGEYIETKDNTWPESGYIFNETLSGCENGGELEYNSGNNTVNLLSNSSDKCYVYFDKYDGVWIDNVNITNVTGSSVTLDVSATSENGNITTYYYALNDSEEYVESTTNPIVINDLNKLTEYKIKIYAIDSTNAKSNIYELTVSTTDESLPVINSVSSSNITEVGFTLTVNATSEVGIERYYFIIESENIAGTSTSNKYTFNNLDGDTNYIVKVFVKDNNNLNSEEYEITVKTNPYILPTLNNITIGELTEDSITVTASATAGTASISQYYFSINNGEYINSTNNTYTFTGLKPTTTYTIKAYVEDINNKRSSEKSVTATTTEDLIEFTLTDFSGYRHTYKAEKDMYWYEFIQSEYNVDQRFRVGSFGIEYYDSTYNRKGYVFLSGYDMIFESNKIIDGATYMIDS